MRADLLPRIFTAVVLIPLVLAGIFLLKPRGFAFASGIIILCAAWEWSRLSGLQGIFSRTLYVLFMGIFLMISFYSPLKWVCILSVMGCIYAYASMAVLRDITQRTNIPEKILGFIMLPACGKALYYLCFLAPHPYNLLTLFLIVWLADISAYFVGSYCGKHKLAPSISPGKSIEGAVGALASVGIITALIFHDIKWVFLALLTVIASIIGDLWESLMKRRQGLKDSGKCLPGHGGILDRIDSLITAAPVFALGMLHVPPITVIFLIFEQYILKLIYSL